MDETFDPRAKYIPTNLRKELEELIGYKMCPFSATQQRNGPEFLSAYGDDIVIVYICGQDLGTALGAQRVKIGSFVGAMSPCPLQYALKCYKIRVN